MKKFLIHLVVNAVSLYAAVAIMNGHGIVPQSTNWLAFLVLALIFGLINAILRPLLTVLSCPLIILTLGLGTLLINTLLFYLAGLLGKTLGVGVHRGRLFTCFPGRPDRQHRQFYPFPGLSRSDAEKLNSA